MLHLVEQKFTRTSTTWLRVIYVTLLSCQRSWMHAAWIARYRQLS